MAKRFSYPAWYLHVYGGHDPRGLLTDWSLIELMDAYYDLRIKHVLE